MQYQQYIYLIPLLPLVSFVVLGLSGRNRFKKSAGIVGTVSMLGSFLLSAYTAYSYFSTGYVGFYPRLVPLHFTWLRFSDSLSIDMGILLDPVSVMMIVVVTFVSLMVHIFSIGYMKGEERYTTYFSFLSLFSFSMLGLVLSSNLFQLYAFWELVGVSSFLLIGFYYNRPSAVTAAKKAFIVTRFADLGFLIGILTLAFTANTLDFNSLIASFTSAESSVLNTSISTSFLGISALTWGLSLVFIGGAGKSAMFPLHIWLPDAMEGPTPVSALIHAATMVVAGVFLVARLFPVFSLDISSLQLVTWVGAFSALLAAVIACTQTDIKRVLAYSTMSQIGYMMFALGVSGYGGENGHGYTASLFHLFTHAFFKSLLFLGAGAVIHLVHSNEMKDMGGLRKHMPVTHLSFLIACLAIAGIPPFAGFFSKEEILAAAYHSNKLVYGVGLLTAGLTAFYMFRLYFNIFWATPNEEPSLPSTDASQPRHSEGTLSMKFPLVVLSLCSLLAGFVPFQKFVTPDGVSQEPHVDWMFSLLPMGLAVSGILLASLFYKNESDRPAKLATAIGGFYKAAVRKFYVDEIYLFITKKILLNGVGRPAAWFDRHVVDGMVNGTASVTAAASLLIKRVQSGKVQQYALYFFAGVAGLVILFVYLIK